MDQERHEVREVEDARRRVAEDVRSVAENANVVERVKETARSKVDDTREVMSRRVRQAREKMEDARDMVKQNLSSPSESPIAMLIAGTAIGFLIGLALPVTRFESERLGPITDDMKDRVRQAGNEVVRRGGEVIKDTIEGTREAATSSIREHTSDLRMGEE